MWISVVSCNARKLTIRNEKRLVIGVLIGALNEVEYR